MEKEDVPAAAAGSGLVQLAEMAPPRPVDHLPADAGIVARIQEQLDNEIALALRNDGGDIEFVRYRKGKVYVRLTGNCAACLVSEVTIKGTVESHLREFVGVDLEVIEVD